MPNFFLDNSQRSFSRRPTNEPLHVLPNQPLSQNFNNVVDMLFCERLALWNVMPFRQALPAAGAGRLLSDRDRTVLHRRLRAVVSRIGVCQSSREKITSVLKDRCEAFLSETRRLFAGKSKPAAKCRPPQKRGKVHLYYP